VIQCLSCYLHYASNMRSRVQNLRLHYFYTMDKRAGNTPCSPSDSSFLERSVPCVTPHFSSDFLIFYFIKFCRTCYFKFWNSILTKNLEMDSSFFSNFYFIFSNLKFNRLVFQKPMKPVPTSFSSFRENRPVFEWFYQFTGNTDRFIILKSFSSSSSLKLKFVPVLPILDPKPIFEALPTAKLSPMMLVQCLVAGHLLKRSNQYYP
jgi:hypothetical protein